MRLQEMFSIFNLCRKLFAKLFLEKAGSFLLSFFQKSVNNIFYSILFYLTIIRTPLIIIPM